MARHIVWRMLCLFIALVFVAHVASGETPTKRALLIGIDDYKAPHIPDLAGAVNDVKLMRNILIGKFDVPDENIRMLTNEQATRAGIIEAIRSKACGDSS
jgi:hypothetical protein